VNEGLLDGYASFERRAIAFVVDFVLITAFHLAIVQLLSQMSYPPTLLGRLLVLVFSFANMIVLPGKTGWSLGKRALSIKIIKTQNRKAGFFDIFYREIIKSWFSLPFLYLGCFWMFLGKRRLTWHDAVADTRVVSLGTSINNSSFAPLIGV
jgi:Mce-associated membrane protein